MKIRPLNDFVLIEFDKIGDTTPGGIIIPGTVDQDRPQVATVRQIHAPYAEPAPAGTTFIKACPVNVGDKIMVGKYAGTDFKIENKKFVFVKDDELLGVIED